jgi:hypothetical protein
VTTRGEGRSWLEITRKSTPRPRIRRVGHLLADQIVNGIESCIHSYKMKYI